jgi:hypothetical protein
VRDLDHRQPTPASRGAGNGAWSENHTCALRTSRHPSVARSKRALAAPLCAAALLLVACGSSSKPGTGTAATTTAAGAAAVAAPVALTGRTTTVTVSPSTLAALAAQSIAIKAVAPASVGRVLTLPITGGHVAVATLSGTIDQGGGITLEHAGRSVSLRSFIVDTASKTITASVGGLRVPVFDLDLASLHRTSGIGGTMVAGDVRLLVSPQAATSLNMLLGVPGLKAGQEFGVATITLAAG